MKCPKCGTDNPAGTLFCEECDWRMDQPVKAEVSFPRIYLTLLAVVLGVVSILLWYLDIAYGAIALGAVGMVLGGYSMTFSRITEQQNKTMLIVLTGIAICTSVVGFIMGLQGLV